MLDYSLEETESVSLQEQGLDQEELARVLKALADPSRLSIFNMLMEGVQCNCEIAERLDLSLNLISHHLRVLRQSGLVLAERAPEDARWIYYSVDTEALGGLSDALKRLLDPTRIQPRSPCCGPRQCKAS